MIYALLAQLVEHLTLNQGVQGSSPWRRTRGALFLGCMGPGAVFFFCPIIYYSIDRTEITVCFFTDSVLRLEHSLLLFR